MIVKLGTIIAFTVACGGARDPGPAPLHSSGSSSSAGAAVASQAPVLVRAELAFVEPRGGVTMFALGANGELRAATKVVGTLSPDGTFVFAGGNGAVTARLAPAGRIEITAATGNYPDLPGDLNKLLRDYNGTVTSGYAVHDDGTATIALARRLAFAADGMLSSGALRVTGLTAETRKTAMFVYVLLSTIIP